MNFFFVAIYLLSAAERRGTPVLLYASVSDNFGNSPQIAAPRRSREIDQSSQRFYVGWFHVGWQGTGDQSDATQISERYQYYYKPGQSLGEGFLYQESAVGRVQFTPLTGYIVTTLVMLIHTLHCTKRDSASTIYEVIFNFLML